MLAAVALAAGCGKGGHVVSGPSSSAIVTQATTTAPAAPQGRPLTAAEERAFAHAVNLTAEDVPGFSAAPKEHAAETPAEEALQRRLQRCLGGSGSGRAKPALSSENFTRRGNVLGQSVSSAVGFASSAAQASAELAQLRSPHTRVCLSGYLEALFRSKRFGGAPVQRVSIAQGTPPAPGTAGGFGWRIRAELLVRGLPVPFYLDILGFVFGPSEVTLQSAGVLVPFPAGAQEQLFSLLLQRARAHPLSG